MRRFGIVLALVAACLPVMPALAADPEPGSPAVYFHFSLHKNRPGKNFWYGTENGGFEAFTGVPIEAIGCTGCHGSANANGIPYPSTYYPGCYDCHRAADWFGFTEDQCFGCHGRQRAEAVQLALPDVHRAAGMKCWDCHDGWDMHGYGVPFATMFDPDAVGTACEDCHVPEFLPAAHAANDPHGGKLHCAACHTRSVISCYNCHFESQVVAGVKRAKQPISDFVLLGNRHEDGKVYPMSFQSLTYQGSAFVAFAPYSAHSIVREARQCTECHVNLPGGSNAAIEEYNATGGIRFASLDGGGNLSWIHGVVPMPEDYATSFRMDFITYDGNPSDPLVPGTNWSAIGKDTWDGHQMFFISPLTAAQMEDLGMIFNPAPILDAGAPSPPAAVLLAPALPNPARGPVRVAWQLGAEAHVRVAVVDPRGREVTVLAEGTRSVGRHETVWDGRDAHGSEMPSGVYFVTVRSGDGTAAGKVILAR